MIIYIAGPYRGDVDRNIENAKNVAVEVWEKGHVALCPHLNTAFFNECCKCEDETYLTGDLKLLARCDCVLMMIDWDKSEGAKTEFEYARDHAIPIFLYPNIPPLHPTEVKNPLQSEGFINIVMNMYRTHLKKNADYCVDPETKVLTGDLQWKKIATLETGTTLVGFDENALAGNERRMFRPSTIETITRVTLPSYRLSLEDGTELISSGEHPWLVSSGYSSKWIKTKNLQAADIYSMPSKIIKILDIWDTHVEYEDGYLAAALDGEGWLSQTPNHRHGGGNCFRLGFAQKNNAMLDYVRSIFDKRGFTYVVHKANGQGTCEQIRLTDMPKKDVIRLIGEVRPKRLLEKLDLNFGMVNLYPVKLLHKEFIGEHELISIKTSVGTYLANGFGSHNSPANILGVGEIGLATRLWDKVARLLNLAGFHMNISSSYYSAPTEPNNESIDDNLLDISVYGVIGMLLRQNIWGR